MIGSRIRAVFDRAEIVGGFEDAFREKETGGKLAIGAGRAHDDGKRPVVQADFERLFGRGPIAIGQANAVPDPHHIDAAKRLGHEAHSSWFTVFKLNLLNY